MQPDKHHTGRGVTGVTRAPHGLRVQDVRLPENLRGCRASREATPKLQDPPRSLGRRHTGDVCAPARRGLSEPRSGS